VVFRMVYSDGTSTKCIKDVSEPILRNELILKRTF
jgi:hypothetical protein